MNDATLAAEDYDYEPDARCARCFRWDDSRNMRQFSRFGEDDRALVCDRCYRDMNGLDSLTEPPRVIEVEIMEEDTT